MGMKIKENKIRRNLLQQPLDGMERILNLPLKPGVPIVLRQAFSQKLPTEKFDYRNLLSPGLQNLPTFSRRSLRQVGRPDHRNGRVGKWFGRIEIKDVVAGSKEIDPRLFKLPQVLYFGPPAVGDILGVGDNKIDLFFLLETREKLGHRRSAEFGNDITDKKNSHLSKAKMLAIKPLIASIKPGIQTAIRESPRPLPLRG